MDSATGLTYISMTLAAEPSRIPRYGAALRKINAYPDGRLTYPVVKPHHMAAAILTFALSPTPDDTLQPKIEELLNLRDADGITVVEALAEMLETGGEQVWIQGLARVSVSLSRPIVVFAFKDPTISEMVNRQSDRLRNYIAVREYDRVFGEGEAMAFEKFAMVKASCLKKMAMELEYSTLNTHEGNN